MRSLLIVFALHVAVLAVASSASASDHADPIDPFRLHPLGPVITDLFVFPADAEGVLVKDANGPIAELVVILCVRRALTNTDPLDLRKYTYTIHIDTKPSICFDETTCKDAIDRYGGKVDNPESITPRVEIAIRLGNEPRLVESTLRMSGAVVANTLPDPVVGIHDDPFIFPRFARTNVVGIVQRIPLTCLPDPKQPDFLVWATTKKGRTQIDHVGRALRTQNPRFELLNTLPPREHVAALNREKDHPSLMRDVALRFDLASLFRFRDWDFEPDVLIYSRRAGVAFPNGRRLDEDVVGYLAGIGETLAFELSYSHRDGRETQHVPAPLTGPPYLLPKLAKTEAVPPPALSLASTLKILFIIVAMIAVVVLVTWWLTHRYYRRKHRRRYLL